MENYQFTCSDQFRSYVQLPRGKTAYYLFGNTVNPKQLWVLVHGIGSYAYCFEWLVNHLVTNSSIAKDVLVLTFDLHGRGFSETASPQNEALFVKQLVDLLKALNLVDFSSCQSPMMTSPISSPRPVEKSLSSSPSTEGPSSEHVVPNSRSFPFPPFKKFTLAGHSMGGAISMIFVHRYPEVVESMFLFSPAGGPFTLPAGPLSIGVKYFLPLSAGQSLYSLITQTVFPDQQIVTGDYFNLQESQKKIKHFIDLRQKNINFKVFNQSIIDALKNFPLNSCQPIIQDLGKNPKYAHVRTLIMWGFYDALVVGHQSFPFFHKAFQNHPNACLLLVHNTRHDFMNERDTAVCHVIEKFIKNFKIPENVGNSEPKFEEEIPTENDKIERKFKIDSVALANEIRKDFQGSECLFGKRPSNIGLFDKIAEKKLMKKFSALVI